MKLFVYLLSAAFIAYCQCGSTIIKKSGSHVFVVSDSDDLCTIEEAKRVCESMNQGIVATVITEAEQELLQKMLKDESVADTFYVGLVRDEPEISRMRGKHSKDNEDDDDEEKKGLPIEKKDGKNKSDSEKKAALYHWNEELPPRLRKGVRAWKLDHVPTKKCVRMDTLGELVSTDCEEKRRYICKMRANVCPKPEVYTVNRNVRVPMYTNKVRPIVYMSEVSFDFETAKKFCKLTGAEYPVYPVRYEAPVIHFRHGNLASILRPEENDFLAKHLDQIREVEGKTKKDKLLKKKKSGVVLEENAVGYYIGGYRKSSDEKFSWLNPIFKSYGWFPKNTPKGEIAELVAPWAKDQPDGKDTWNRDTDANCVMMGERADANQWTDVDCGRRGRFICKYFCPVPVRKRDRKRHRVHRKPMKMKLDKIRKPNGKHVPAKALEDIKETLSTTEATTVAPDHSTLLPELPEINASTVATAAPVETATTTTEQPKGSTTTTTITTTTTAAPK